MNTPELISKLAAAASAISEEIDSRKVIKSVPMRKEWKAKWELLEKARAEETAAERKATSLKRQFWAKVEEDLEEYGSMSYNEETGEIEIYGE